MYHASLDLKSKCFISLEVSLLLLFSLIFQRRHIKSLRKLNLMQVKDVEHVVMAVLMLLAYQPLLKLVGKHVGLLAGEQHKKMEIHQLQ